MDISIIIQIISTVGFPIFVCIYQFYNNSTVIKQLKESIDELKTSIADNSRVISLIEQHFFTGGNKQ